ncbi:uncharacterized protein LOC124368289 [Homalodisca vitripennis]|uniref:uncharacterized protein LOC124368289 n=1 Tax=Homalodisca vitripennis TaxID=197043 RepID=UPI001EE9CCB2|nr:uncharacterized protein LOC124368289 [Homalodisca vitripennis]
MLLEGRGLWCPASRSANCFLPEAIKAIKRRLQARISLCIQLQALEGGKLPNIPEVRSCFPQKLLTELTHWSALSWTAYQALGFTQQQITRCCVSERDRFYKGNPHQRQCSSDYGRCHQEQLSTVATRVLVTSCL